MSKIIYLKDIMMLKEKKNNKKARPKLKPFKHDAILKSSLVEKRKDEQVKK